MRTFNQMKDFINLILQIYTKDTSNLYSCASKKQRALTVARSLVDTWEIAADFVGVVVVNSLQFFNQLHIMVMLTQVTNNAMMKNH